jgi:hypothetical protein
MNYNIKLADGLKNRSGELLIILVTLPIYYFFPILVLLLWIAYHCYFYKHKVLTLALISITFGLIASTTKSISYELTDIERYKSAYYKLVGATSFSEVLFHSVVTSGEINVLFISVNYFFTRVFPSYFPVVPFFWVSVTYFFTLLTFYQYSQNTTFTKHQYLFYFVIVVLVGIPFYQTTETIKQCSAIAIMGYSLVLKTQNKKGGLFWLIISLLVHLSGLFLLPVFFMLNNKKVIKYAFPMFVVALLISFININDLFTDVLGDYLGSGFKDRAMLYADYSWSLSRRYYVILVLYGLVTYFLFVSINKQKSQMLETYEVNARLFNLQILAFVFLLINRSNIHNFVRYTLTYFPFYILFTLQVLNVLMPKRQKVLIWLFLVLFFGYSNFLLLSLRTDNAMGYANSYLDNSFIKLFTYNVSDILKFNVNE